MIYGKVSWQVLEKIQISQESCGPNNFCFDFWINDQVLRRAQCQLPSVPASLHSLQTELLLPESSYIFWDRFINGNVHCKWSYSKEKEDKATVEVMTEGKRKQKIFLKWYDKIMQCLSTVNLHSFLLILFKCQVSVDINQKYSSETVC